jgi:hypothetical protein
MSISLWVLLFAVDCAFTYWVLRLNGSHWLEGWRTLLVIDWLFAYRWTAEQIELYVLLCWLGHIVWFFAGLFSPTLRFYS